jgi:putative ABC transport system substrate-binding protein
VDTSRRALLLGPLAALLGSRVVRAQPAERVARVGILGPTTAEHFAAGVKAFREGLRERGWIEGRDLTIEARFAQQRYDRLPALAAELVSLKVDAIFALASPSVAAAKRATTTIPIVFETLGDAVGTGLVTNLARPGANVTGVSGFAPELSGKRLELIRELLPRAERVGLLANPANPGTRTVIRATEAAARRMGIVIHTVDVQSPGDLDGAFEAMMRPPSHALLVVADPMLFSHRGRIVELATRHRLPAVYEHESFTDAGGLASYGPDQTERFWQAAAYVDRILKGAQPGDLPIQQPSTFELVLNLQTATRLGLTIPPTLRLRATHVID